LPMRNRRWCCEIIKEAGGMGRVVVVGNRRAEGNIRSSQKCFEKHRKLDKAFLRPIIDFDDYDIWQYIKENNLPYCSLYDEGFKRLGCVLCPYERNIEREEYYFPKIVNLWKLSCNRIVEATKARGYKNKRGEPVKHRFETGQELYDWWVKRK